MKREKAVAIFSLVMLIMGAIYGLFLLTFLGSQLWTEEEWILELHKKHFVALVCIPFSGFGALLTVLALGFRYGDQMEFKFLGVEFKGTSGPIVLFTMIFLSFVLALKLLWPLS